MPRFVSFSVDETRRSGDVSFPRLSHAASAFELGKSKHSANTFIEDHTLPRRLHVVPSSPLSLTSQNIPRLTSESNSSSSNCTSISPLGSERDGNTLSFRDVELHTAAAAYPSPPASVHKESTKESLKAAVVSESDNIPFPLKPAPVLAFNSTIVTDAKGPQTPKKNYVARGLPNLKSPPPGDRYISNRDRPQDLSKTFQLSKSPDQLSPSEKLLRNNSATPDPFSPLNIPRLRSIQSEVAPDDDPLAIRSRSRTIGVSNIPGLTQNNLIVQNRQASVGAVWNVGGNAQASYTGPIRSVSDGRGGFVSSGSNAPMYTSQFLDDDTLAYNASQMEGRIATALDIDRTSRVLNISRFYEQPRRSSANIVGLKRKSTYVEPRTRWRYGEWVQEGSLSLLDAPSLRDDYYCTVLAYCESTRTLAVGLGNKVYLWSEASGVRYPPDDPSAGNSYVTSVSFSSAEGGHSILAIGRNSGQISLWTLHDPENVRFQSHQPSAIACVAFKPVTTRRPSERFGCIMATEELLVGDEVGSVYYYSVEWMSKTQMDIHGWNGAMTLMAKINVHSQQICGLAWSPDGEYFASGANDNLCCLFEVNDVLAPPEVHEDPRALHRRPFQNLIGGFGLPNFIARTQNQADITGILSNGTQVQQTRVIPGQNGSLLIEGGREKYNWAHSAAIKAIAFCPWQRGLIATGGGSNDRAIHFYHTNSGACLATINVYAQVTSLIWSTTRREIAATFGYAQPEHPYRIAVFSWPDCKQVVAIPWVGDMRALYAIPYPGGPGESNTNTTLGETWYSRTKAEGCIVVACSDESVKFHEIWSGASKSTGSHAGLLGGSDILDGLEGIDKEGAEVIR